MLGGTPRLSNEVNGQRSIAIVIDDHKGDGGWDTAATEGGLVIPSATE